ncbi:hypothetical protein ACSQ67_010275 [Phaseolus vulgaris]
MFEIPNSNELNVVGFRWTSKNSTSDPDIISSIKTLFTSLIKGEQGAQIVAVPELVEFLMSTLVKVRNVPVTCTKILLISLDYEPPRTKSFKTIEASLRVDALASAGFKISRSKLVNMISNGDVCVNWIPVTTKGTTLKSGDIISVSGKGRLKKFRRHFVGTGKLSFSLM